MPSPIATESALREHLTAWLKKTSKRSRTILVRAEPTWSGPKVLTVGDVNIHVIEGISGLTALDAMRALPDGHFAAVLTDLTEAQLGSAVVLDAFAQKLTDLDEWSYVAGTFGLRDDASIPRPVRELGAWVPRLLAEWHRDRPYPQLPPGAVLTPQHVANALLMALLGLTRAEDLDLSNALAPLDDQAVRVRLRELDSDTRHGLLRAVSDHIEPHLSVALATASRPGNVSPIAVGLAVAELWATGNVPPDATVAAARVRAEEYLGRAPSAAAVQRFGEGAKLIAQRWLASGDHHATEVLDQAEALFAEWGWPEGPGRSDFLPAGLRARIRVFADAVGAAAAEPSAHAAVVVEQALVAIDGHGLHSQFAGSRPTALMATRLVRWLHSAPTPSLGLGDALESYAADGAWVDRALGDLWDGDTDEGLASAYRAVALTVQAKRREQDRVAANALTGWPVHDDQIIPVEELLAQVVVPLSSSARVLLIVLDGMSIPTALELVDELAILGWGELLKQGRRHRAIALAALPTVTEFSRTSLLAGELLAGDQYVEKMRFKTAVSGVVYHKDDLRSEAGYALPAAVTKSIADPSQKIVAAVLNTIDDALASADVDALRWTSRSIAKLEALLAATQDAGRIVIVTSDHGHIVERGSELRALGDSSARWRTESRGPARDDEVLVEGPRVLAPGGRAVLAVSDGLRYTAKKAGYHGGASLAELAVPILVLKHQGAPTPAGWVEPPPQEPVWWNEPTRVEQATPVAATRTKPAKLPARSEPTLFDTEPEVRKPSAPVTSLGTRLTQSDPYQARKGYAGRHPVEDVAVVSIVDLLVLGGGRAHRDTLAAHLGVPAYVFDRMLVALRRRLNVDGYPVLDVDADGVTVLLDIALLREQFGLGGT